MQRVVINIEEVLWHLEKGSLLSFSFFIKSKMLLGNSVVYSKNTPYRKIATKFGCSHTAVRKYLSELKSEGLVYEHSGNLCFSSKKKLLPLKKENKVYIFLSKDYSIRQISDMLKFAVLKKNAEQQTFMAKLKSDCKSDKGRVNIKAKRKYINSKPGVKMEPDMNLVISNKKLAKKLNLKSEQSVSYLKKKWHDLGVVQFYRQFQPLSAINSKNSAWYNKQKNIPGIFCSNKGVLYKSLPSKFILVGQEGLVDYPSL